MKVRFEWPQPIQGLESDLDRVDEIMLEAVGDGRLGQAAAELIKRGGKRLRPALALTAAALGGHPPTKQTIRAAAAIELIHLASLAHDDLLDGSPARRGQPSSAAAHGQAFAVLMGDFLLSKAFSVSSADSRITELLSDTVAVMAEGVIAELSLDSGRPVWLSGGYLEIVRQKTGGLFSAGAAAGAISGGLPPRDVASLRLYGEDFGAAFQLIDDLADEAMSKDQKGRVVSEIKRRNRAAIKRLVGFKGPAPQSLRELPAAYLEQSASP